MTHTRMIVFSILFLATALATASANSPPSQSDERAGFLWLPQYRELPGAPAYKASIAVEPLTDQYLTVLTMEALPGSAPFNRDDAELYVFTPSGVKPVGPIATLDYSQSDRVLYLFLDCQFNERFPRGTNWPDLLPFVLITRNTEKLPLVFYFLVEDRRTLQDVSGQYPETGSQQTGAAPTHSLYPTLLALTPGPLRIGEKE